MRTTAFLAAALLLGCAPKRSPLGAVLELAEHPLLPRNNSPAAAREDASGLVYGARYRCYVGDSLAGQGYFHNIEGDRIRLSEDTLAWSGDLRCLPYSGETAADTSHRHSAREQEVRKQRLEAAEAALTTALGAAKAATVIFALPLCILTGDLAPCRNLSK